MGRNIFVSLALALLICSCAGMSMYGSPASNGHGCNITHAEKNTRYGNVSIEYKSNKVLRDEKLKALDNRLADDATKRRELASIPDGGIIFICIRRLTIGAANTNYFEYVIKEGDREVYRASGDNDIPEIPSSARGLWWNTDVIYVMNDFENITLYVIDKLLGGRDQFIVTKPPSAT